MSETNFTFLLVGKTGVGKSAVGNSLLGQYKFVSNDSSESVTSQYSIESAQRLGFSLTVVDTPGLMDTRSNADESISKACENMKLMMRKCPTNGKLAVVLVIKYGDRSTYENKTALTVLQHIFGKDDFYRSCIIIMTHGERFDMEYEGKKGFREYLKEQKGPLGDLLLRCRYYCVLFYNQTKSLVKKNQQLNAFLHFAQLLDQGYTKVKFKNAEREQNRVKLESKLSTIKEKFQIEIQHFVDKKNSLNLSLDSLVHLVALENEIDQCIARANKKDNPEKIYYHEGEEKFLEDIRAELNNLNDSISEIKEHFEQLKMKKNLTTAIQDIAKRIDQNNLTDEENGIDKDDFENQIRDTENDIIQLQLSQDIKNELLLEIDNVKQQLKFKTIEVQQGIETSLYSKILSIIDILKTLNSFDKNASDTIVSIKNEIKDILCQLEINENKISKDCVEHIKLQIKKCEDDLFSKEEHLKLRSHIEELGVKIAATDPNDTDIYTLISIYEKDFKNVQSLISSNKFNVQFTNDLMFSLSQSLKDLKNTVQTKKENEIRLEIKNIVDELKSIESSNEDIYDILKHLIVKLNNIKCRLEAEFDQMDKDFIETVLLDLSNIEEDIKKTKDTCRQRTILNNLENELKTLISDISKAETKDEQIYNKMHGFEENLKHLSMQIKTENFTSKLFSNLNKAKKKLGRLFLKVKESKESEIYSKIEELSEKVNTLESNVPNDMETLSFIQNEILDIKQNIEKQKKLIGDGALEDFNKLLNDIRIEIERKELSIQQSAKYIEIQKQIEEVIDCISRTDLNDSEINKSIQEFENNMISLSSMIETEHLNHELTYNLKEKLNELKLKVTNIKERRMYSKIKDINEQLNNINTHDETVLGTLSGIKDNIQDLANQLERDKEDMSKTIRKTVKLSIEQFQKDVMNKEETVKQLLKVNDIKVKIEDITKRIHDTDPRDKDMISMLSTFKADISNIKVTIPNDFLKQESMDTLNVTLNEAEKELKALNEKVREINEAEIKDQILAFQEQLQNLKGNSDIVSEEKLNKIKQDIIILKDKINLDNKFLEISFVDTALQNFQDLLAQVEEQQNAYDQKSTAKNIKEKIDDIIKCIRETDPKDREFKTKVSKFDEDIKEIHCQIAYLNRDLKADLKLMYTDAKSELKNLKKNK